MKIVSLAIFLSFFMAQRSNAQQIAQLVNNQPIWTINTVALISCWNGKLKTEAQIEAQINTLQIVNTENGYLLVGSGAAYTSKLALVTVNRDGNTVLVCGNISCTSKECATTSGCVPSTDKTKCTPCGLLNTGDCTKTVSSLSNGNFFDCNL